MFAKGLYRVKEKLKLFLFSYGGTNFLSSLFWFGPYFFSVSVSFYTYPPFYVSVIIPLLVIKALVLPSLSFTFCYFFLSFFLFLLSHALSSSQPNKLTRSKTIKKKLVIIYQVRKMYTSLPIEICNKTRPNIISRSLLLIVSPFLSSDFEARTRLSKCVIDRRYVRCSIGL